MIGAWCRSCLWCVLSGLFAVAVRAAPAVFKPVADEAARVVIVANSNDPDSVELARYYSDRRGIPRENIVELDLPVGEEINWPVYVSRLHEPLRNWLIERDWISAIAMDLQDDAGRTKMSISGHRISYLVTCRGVPLKIRQTDEIPADLPDTTRKSFQTNSASVDSELTLLVKSDSRRHGFLPNPVFQKTAPNLWDREAMVRVARLDGPSFSAIRNLVESALSVEKYGLIGRALVDVGGPHKLGDKWFEEAVTELVAGGWAPDVDRDRGTVPPTARVDELALYLGWYAGEVNGPFAPPGFEFATGAIALHLHSFSARSLRTLNNGGWVAPLIGRGAAAVFGNVYEPYLEFTHQPQLLVRALLGGATLGEAAYYAMPVLSWQSIVVGDPLYRPFTVPFEWQWENREALTARQASYVALRRLAMMAEAPVEARLEMVNTLMSTVPSLALAFEQAKLKEAAGDRMGAIRALGIAGFSRRIAAEEWGLVAAMAEMLETLEDLNTATKLWGNLLAQELPKDLRITWLRKAVDLGRSAGAFSQVSDWERELLQLTIEVTK